MANAEPQPRSYWETLPGANTLRQSATAAALEHVTPTGRGCPRQPGMTALTHVTGTPGCGVQGGFQVSHKATASLLSLKQQEGPSAPSRPEGGLVPQGRQDDRAAHVSPAPGTSSLWAALGEVRSDCPGPGGVRTVQAPSRKLASEPVEHALHCPCSLTSPPHHLRFLVSKTVSSSLSREAISSCSSVLVRSPYLLR